MPSPTPCRILLVDDEPIILQILTAVLEDGPWEIVTCSKGQQALELLEDGNVGVMVSDKNLPDINGLELLRHAKQADPSTEVLIITGYASLETALAALELGAFDYILKPLNNVFEVRHKVEKAVERRALSLQNTKLIEELSAQNQELQQALMESSKLAKKLLQSEKLAGLGTLAAGMAHEISSPLFGVLGLAEAMREEDSVEACHALAEEIVDYANAMRELVVDLTRYARPADSIPNSEVQLRQIVDDAIRLVGHTINVDHIEFLKSIP